MNMGAAAVDRPGNPISGNPGEPATSEIHFTPGRGCGWSAGIVATAGSSGPATEYPHSW
jgi:hypothetical protein